MRADRSLVRDDVLKSLSKSPEGLTNLQLSKRLGYSRNAISMELTKLIKNDTVGMRPDEMDGRHQVFFLRTE